eukprot:COSAG06_NODE_1126_length_10609_cov_228.247383_7_plen_116_part_00
MFVYKLVTGNKRKLSVGIALLADSRVIFLVSATRQIPLYMMMRSESASDEATRRSLHNAYTTTTTTIIIIIIIIIINHLPRNAHAMLTFLSCIQCIRTSRAAVWTQRRDNPCGQQ